MHFPNFYFSIGGPDIPLTLLGDTKNKRFEKHCLYAFPAFLYLPANYVKSEVGKIMR
jgi:hypothetical protein